MPNPMFEVYQGLTSMGFSCGGDFDQWKKRVQIFHVTKGGGIAFLVDNKNTEIWWLDAFCPNGKPSNNTVRFLIKLAFQSGCKFIASEIRRSGTGRMLERLGFKEIGKQLYTIGAT